MPHQSVPHRLHFGALVVLAALILTYQLVDEQLRVGPRWLFPAILLILFVPLVFARQQDKHDWAHRFGLAIASMSMLAIASSIAVLVRQLMGGHISAANLLRDAALLWVGNVFVFSLCYWELDSGGPAVRHTVGYTPTDFAFPQTTLGGRYADGWIPGFTDYLFVAFNTSSAFSPTDTMVLSRRAKLLMMAQSLMAIVALAVLAARAINTLR